MAELWELTIPELRSLMDRREVSSLDIVRSCLARVEALDRNGPAIRAMIETNPQAEDIARALDDEALRQGARGPLHGIPIPIKDNIDTADEMQTTAGSLALAGVRRGQDASVAAALRRAGAVLLGKLNLSEWANFRSTKSSSGWSARGGQALNPFVLDRSPVGSSSGSGSAVAAGYAPATLGSETCGSIIAPGAACGVVAIKPTVGLTSRAGVIPVAHSQDTIGPFARTVADAAMVLSAIAGPDPRDPATLDSGITSPVDYAATLSTDALRGARIGVPRKGLYGYSAAADAIAERALSVMRDLGAEIVEDANIPSLDEIGERRPMLDVLLYEFKADLNAYLSALPDSPVRSLEDVIRFNEAHPDEEMPYFRQEISEQAQQKGPLTDPEYIEILGLSRRLSRDEGIDAAIKTHRLDALVAPTTGPSFLIDHANGDSTGWGSALIPGMAGYPVITVPAGLAGELPIGISFFGRAFSDASLLRFAHAYEQAAQAFRWPRFIPSVGQEAEGTHSPWSEVS
jgi:amidase